MNRILAHASGRLKEALDKDTALWYFKMDTKGTAPEMNGTRTELNESKRPAATPSQLIDLFLAIAGAPWVSIHLILRDGSFWPPSTDRQVLERAVHMHPIAGVIGFTKISETQGKRFVRCFDNSPEGRRAVAAACDALDPAALVRNVPEESHALN